MDRSPAWNGLEGPRWYVRPSPTNAWRDREGYKEELIAQKIIFRVHGCNVQGTVMVSKSVRHQELPAFVAKPAPCLVGDGGHTAHYWGPAEPSAGFLFPMIVTHN